MLPLVGYQKTICPPYGCETNFIHSTKLNILQTQATLLLASKSDRLLTPSDDTEILNYGQIETDPSYYFAKPDNCPFRHRRRVKWSKKSIILRSALSVPFQNTIRSSLTIFAVSQRDEFFSFIDRKDLISVKPNETYDPYLSVLNQVLQLNDKEFEILFGHLLTALGFDGSEVTGRTGDGGVDATGELNVANLAKIKIFVQAKRYKLGSKIAANIVKQLRQAIPVNGQGAFITTADYQQSAFDVALEPGFPRIGLVNGRQLVDLLVEHWSDIPSEFQERLGLKPGLVRA